MGTGATVQYPSWGGVSPLQPARERRLHASTPRGSLKMEAGEDHQESGTLSVSALTVPSICWMVTIPAENSIGRTLGNSLDSLTSAQDNLSPIA